MINRLIERLVLLFPAARAVRLGMIDGASGAQPLMAGYYYLGGYQVGRAKYFGESPGKA